MKREVSRMAGILMPIASLPSGDGVGGFGKAAYQFVDFLAETGFRIWQVLPLNPLGYGNSPYQPYSSYAGDELYIDLELLEKDGYLPHNREALPNTGHIDYEKQGRINCPGSKRRLRRLSASRRKKKHLTPSARRTGSIPMRYSSH